MKFSFFHGQIRLPLEVEYRIITKISVSVYLPYFVLRLPGGQCLVEKGRSVLLQTIFSFFQEEIPILSTIKVKDLVDVAILSLVIYKALWLMRKTSSGRVLRASRC